MRPIQVNGHTRPLTQIKYNRDGDLIFSAAKDKSPNVWFSNTGERLGSFEGHNGAVYGLDIDYNSQRLITCSADMSSKIWDVETGKELYSFDFKTVARSVEYSFGYREMLVLTETRQQNQGLLTIFPVASSIGSRNFSSTKFDGLTFHGLETSIPLQSIVMPGARATIARWGNLNKVIFTCHEDGTICSWDPVTGERQKTIKPHDAQIMDLQMSKDRSYFITASKDATSKIIDAHTLEEIKLYQSDRPLNSAAISPICDHVILGGGQEARDVTTTSARAGKFEVLFYHRVLNQEIGKLKAHFSPINTLAFHPNGESFSSGAEEGYVRIYHFDQDYLDAVEEI